MLKKAILTAGVLGIGAVTLLGTDVCSYGRTLFSNTREAVRAEIKPEFELDRIRGEVDRLMPEIKEHMKVVAEQVVNVRNMQQTIADKEAQLLSQREAILALRSDLDSGQNEYEYRQVSYTRQEVESDLGNRFDAFRLLEDSVSRDQKILKALKDTLRANQQELDSMMARKQNFAVKLSQSEARLKQIQATETVNAIEVDDTQLSHVEKLLDRLNHSLDVREALLETEGHTTGRIPVEQSTQSSPDVISEIDQHFGLARQAGQRTELASASDH